jgi:hypothetical protein
MSSTQGRRRWALIASVVAAILGSLAAASAASAATVSQAKPPNVSSAAVDAITPVATAAEARAARFPSAYGGIQFTDHGSHVVVYLTSLDPAIERAIRGADPAGDFTFVQTPHSLEWMLALEHRITQDQAALAKDGIKLEMWGPDIASGLERVDVVSLDGSATRELGDRYGASNLSLHSVSPGSLPRAIANRQNDTPPWNGGDFITDITTGDCSSAFGAGGHYLITAAHCFPNGDSVFNGSITQDIGTFATMGTVTRQDTSSGGLDAELVDASVLGTSHAVFTGSSSNPVESVVSGTTGSPLSAQVCMDGAFEGEICGLVIETGSMCINVQQDDGSIRTICSIFEADNTSGGIANGQGDSGGPVFRFSGALLEANGVVSAGGGTVTQCPTRQVQPGRLCFSKLFYTDVGAILSEMGISINL